MDKFFNIKHILIEFLSSYNNEQLHTHLYSLAAVIFIFAFVIYKIKRRRFEKIINQFDGPKALPLIGNGLLFVGCTEGAMNELLKLLTTYNNSFRIWLFYKPIVCITTPEDCQIVATETLEKDTHYKFLAEAIGDSIVTTEVEKWKKHRRILNPAFNPNILLQFFLQIFNKQNIALINEFKKEVGTGQHFELLPYINQAAINTILETALDYKDSSENTTERIKFDHALSKAISWAALRFHNPWLAPSFIFAIYQYLFGYGDVHKTLKDLPLKAIKKQRERLHSLKKENYDSTTKEHTVRNFIRILVNDQEANNQYTEDEMVREAINIVFAGSETTAETNCFCLLMFSIRQDIQDKVYQEIHQVFGDSNRLPTPEDLNKLSYLEQCIKETLRKFPVVPLAGRYTQQEIPISNGKIIPAGCSIILGIYGIHHNPEVYPNPEIWDPNNFSPEKIASRHKSSLVAFSTGPRNCLGWKYAMLSMKTQLSTLIRNFKFTTDCKMQDIKLDVGLSLRSVHGFPIKLQYRHKESLF